MSDPLDHLVEAVLASPKYKDVCQDLVRGIGAQELSKRLSSKAAIKATKNKLHQIAGAYQSRRMAFDPWLDDLSVAVRSGEQEQLRSACVNMMRRHISTKERLPIIDQFYAVVLADVEPIHTVIDIACGLNPLAIPWMPLPADVDYRAYDVYQDMADFLSEFLSRIGINGAAEARDVIQSCPTQHADVAFILKAIPCLEQIDRAAGEHLLNALNVNFLVVSFPVHSLGGRNKGMVSGYESRFQKLVENRSWSVKRFEFSTELVFLIEK